MTRRGSPTSTAWKWKRNCPRLTATCNIPVAVSYTHLEIDLLKESGEKRRRQIRLNYDKEIAELAAQEKKWKDAQKGKLTGEQESTLKEAREKAAAARDGDLAKVTREENDAARQSMLDYLKEYGLSLIHIFNSNGGEVYAGIAIFNALKNSKADITIYVDGIAASMASVIALCGKPVQMSRSCENKYKGIILPFKKIYQNEGYLKYPNKIYAELEKE